MLRSTTIFLVVLLSVFLTSTYINATIPDRSAQAPGPMTRSFILSLIDRATGEERSVTEKEELIRLAKGFSDSYTQKTGDKSLKKELRQSIRKLPKYKKKADTEPSLNSSDLDFYEKLIDRQQHKLDMDLIVKEFVISLIEKSLDRQVEGEADLYKEAALDISKTYSALKGSGGFLRVIENIMSTLPSKTIETDEDILLAFQEAMRHQNTVVKEYLVKKIQLRIKEVVKELTNEATSEITTDARREELLKTSMNITQTYAKLTNDNEFHRTNLKKIFTARLSTPKVSLAVDKLHTIDARSRKNGDTLTEESHFTPNNIIIQAGETVRWQNKATVAHDIRTIDFLSDGHFTAPGIEPDGDFEYLFTTPGDYYYISLTKKNMYGKITVVE